MRPGRRARGRRGRGGVTGSRVRIGIVAVGSWGDVGPLVTLGARLVDAGYEVVLVTHATYADDAGRAGLDFAPLSGDPVAIPEDEDGRQWLESGGNGLRFGAHLVRHRPAAAARAAR